MGAVAMGKKSGLMDLAVAAGVSVATVDRCLNGRESVAAGTRARILDAALRMGHPAAQRLMAEAKLNGEPQSVPFDDDEDAGA